MAPGSLGCLSGCGSHRVPILLRCLSIHGNGPSMSAPLAASATSCSWHSACPGQWARSEASVHYPMSFGFAAHAASAAEPMLARLVPNSISQTRLQVTGGARRRRAPPAAPKRAQHASVACHAQPRMQRVACVACGMMAARPLHLSLNLRLHWHSEEVMAAQVHRCISLRILEVARLLGEPSAWGGPWLFGQNVLGGIGQHCCGSDAAG
mmetsp:Transcript_48389/g.121983  ORF Transcript_48389/g.121983 Transcript_48389/m.121983 type:complete len:209 (-) Transcript_48389:8-634(-)